MTSDIAEKPARPLIKGYVNFDDFRVKRYYHELLFHAPSLTIAYSVRYRICLPGFFALTAPTPFSYVLLADKLFCQRNGCDVKIRAGHIGLHISVLLN